MRFRPFRHANRMDGEEAFVVKTLCEAHISRVMPCPVPCPMFYRFG